jgi:hypothetical protein
MTRLNASFAAALIALLSVAPWASPGAAERAAQDGLVPVKDRNLDRVLVRPGAELASYRKIMLDPVDVSWRKGWEKDAGGPTRATRGLSTDDARHIAAEAAASLRKIFSDTFRARGYEIVTAPGPGVLRLTPRLRDFYVNAPSKMAPGVQSYTVYAGEATLELEARDGATGELVARVVDRRTTDLRRAVPTSGTSNRFAFESMFSRWAANCAKAFQSGKKKP